MKQFVKRHLTALYVSQMQRIIKKHKPLVIAVAGSVGKTSTKLAIATVVSEKYRVLVQNGNYNVALSVPFIFFDRELPSLTNPISWFSAWLHAERVIRGSFPYDVVVIELSPDELDQDVAFKDIINPDITVLTAVSAEHMEYFSTLDTIAEKEFAIATHCRKLLLGSDDIAATYIDRYTKHIEQPVLRYGFIAPADCLVAQAPDNSQSVSVRFADGLELTTQTNLLAKHSIKSLAAAALVAKELGLSGEQIVAGTAKVVPFAGRMQLLKGIKDSTIIDDSYNASPLAVAAALETLQSVAAPQRIALLGNMNELGDTSKDAHEQIGKLCDVQKLDLVVTLGKDANQYTAATAEQHGCKVVRTNSPYEAGKVIADNLQTGAYVLIKGSQNGVFSEEAIKSILADPADAAKLVRQSAYWFAIKRSQFADAHITSDISVK